MEEIKIIPATIKNLNQLQRIARKTFSETFAAFNSEINMIKYIDENFSSTQLSYELSNKNVQYYLATTGNAVIAYLKLNFDNAQTEPLGKHAVEIVRIYVLKKFQGKKIGQKLFNKAIELAKQKKANYIWLGVWENNTKALAFYRKNGFTEFDKHTFTLGNDKQTDILMKHKL